MVLNEHESDDLPVPDRKVYFVSEFGTLRRRDGDVMTPFSNKRDSAFQTIMSRHELRDEKHIVQVVVAKDLQRSIKLINARIPAINDNKQYSNRNSFNINKWAY